MATFEAHDLDEEVRKRLQRAKVELEAETNPDLVNKLLQEARFDDE